MTLLGGGRTGSSQVLGHCITLSQGLLLLEGEAKAKLLTTWLQEVVLLWF